MADGDGRADPSVEPREQRRRLPEWPLLVAVAGIVLGLLVNLLNGWRVGAIVVGVSVLLAGGLRLFLPVRVLGLLVVRSRPVDVAVLVGAGTAITVLAAIVPPPPT